MAKIVLDTNIIVRAVASPFGLASELLRRSVSDRNLLGYHGQATLLATSVHFYAVCVIYFLAGSDFPSRPKIFVRYGRSGWRARSEFGMNPFLTFSISSGASWMQATAHRAPLGIPTFGRKYHPSPVVASCGKEPRVR